MTMRPSLHFVATRAGTPQASGQSLRVRMQPNRRSGSLSGSVAPWLLSKTKYSVTPVRLAFRVLAPETGYNPSPDNKFRHDNQLRETLVSG